MPFNKFRRRDLTTKVPERREYPLPWPVPAPTDTLAYPNQSSFPFSPNVGYPYPYSSSVPPLWPSTYYSAFSPPNFSTCQSSTFLNNVPTPIVRTAASAHELNYYSTATMAPLVPGPAGLTTRQTIPPIGVFWDIENCQVPKGRSALVAIQSIREQFVSKYHEAEFICVCDITKEPPHVIQELNDAQISVVHVAGNSKNAADDKLRQSMRRFADIHTTISPQPDALPATILLISGDVNFATDLYDLRYRKRLYVILLHNKQAPQSLVICANEHFDFYSILGDLPYRPTREDFDDEKDIPSKGGHNQMDVVVSELPPMKNVNKVKMRLKKLSDNCGGKVMNVQGQFAVLRFPNKEAAARASKRMNGEDVFGSKIRVLYSSQIEISQTQTQEQSSTMIATQVLQPSLALASSSQPGPSSYQHQLPSMPIMRNGSGSPGSGGSYHHLQQKKKPTWKRASASAEQDSVVDYDTLKKEVASLLQDVPNRSLPLFKFREMFERRYRRSVSSYDLYRMRDVVNISESSAMSSSSSGSNSPCSGRNISLNQDWIFKEDDLTFFCKQHPPKSSGILKMRTGWAEKEVTPSMPIVIIELKTLATRVHALLHSHDGYVPVLSFMDCYESVFGPMEISHDGHGVPLEHLLTCIQGVELGLGENGLKRIQWTDKRELESQNGFSQPQALQMAQLSRELIDLLRTFPRCCLAFAKLIPAYHHHFGRQCRVADYNHATLSSLLKTLPQTIQVMGENQNRILTLAHKAQMKRFATDVLRILKAQGGPAKQVKLEDFGHHYLQVFPNRAFCPEDYGLCYLQDLVSELVETSSLVALVNDEDGNDVLAIPKREQSPLEIHKTRVFATEVFDLLRHSIRCEMPFSKFIPAYHHHFGRQCRVADYGFSKLAELFESITDTVVAVNPRNIAPHQECSMDDKILRLTPKEQVKVIGEQLWYMVEMRQKAGLGTTLDDLEELFLKQYGFALRPELCEAESVLDLVINKLSHLLKVDSNNYLIMLDRAQQEQLVYSAKSILEAQPDCTMRLEDFVAELKKHCKDADLQLIQTDLGHLTIISQDDHDVERITYAPIKAFGMEITELLDDIGGHVLLVNFENAYFNKFGRQIRPGHFGCSTLTDLLNGFPEIVTIRGASRSKRTIVLNSRSGSYDRRQFVNKAKHYNLAPVPSNNYNGKGNGHYQNSSDSGSRSPKWRGVNNATVVTPPLYNSAPPSPMYATRGPTEGTAFTYDRIPQLSPSGYDMWVRDTVGGGPPASVSPPVVWAYHPVVYPGPPGSPAASPNMMLPPQLSFGSSPWSPPPTPVMVFEPPRMAANSVGLGIGLDQNGAGAMYLTNQNHLAQSFQRVKISSED